MTVFRRCLFANFSSSHAQYVMRLLKQTFAYLFQTFLVYPAHILLCVQVFVRRPLHNEVYQLRHGQIYLPGSVFEILDHTGRKCDRLHFLFHWTAPL